MTFKDITGQPTSAFTAETKLQVYNANGFSFQNQIIQMSNLSNTCSLQKMHDQPIYMVGANRELMACHFCNCQMLTSITQAQYLNHIQVNFRWINSVPSIQAGKTQHCDRGWCEISSAWSWAEEESEPAPVSSPNLASASRRRCVCFFFIDYSLHNPWFRLCH